jgi:branched-chain amino acid transport system substrate-binding protein
VTGKITIDAERNAIKPAVILEMKDGQSTYITTIEPPTLSTEPAVGSGA